MKARTKMRLKDMATAALWALGIALVLFFTFEMGAKFGELMCVVEMREASK